MHAVVAVSTLAHLLTHPSAPFRPFTFTAVASSNSSRPGTQTTYTDRGPVILALSLKWTVQLSRLCSVPSVMALLPLSWHRRPPECVRCIRRMGSSPSTSSVAFACYSASALRSRPCALPLLYRSTHRCFSRGACCSFSSLIRARFRIGIIIILLIRVHTMPIAISISLANSEILISLASTRIHLLNFFTVAHE